MERVFEFGPTLLVIKIGDLTAESTEAIVCPANSFGHMRGGVAAAIRQAGGDGIESEAIAKSPMSIGSAVLTSAGRLKARYVIHTPTMVLPVERTNVEVVRRAVRAALTLAQSHKLESLAFPGMGTGTGWLQYEDAAEVMLEEVRAELTTPGCQIKKVVFVARSADFFDVLVISAERMFGKGSESIAA